jgi:hypothetical protein
MIILISFISVHITVILLIVYQQNTHSKVTNFKFLTINKKLAIIAAVHLTPHSLYKHTGPV